jgi:hypothetical protein
MSGTKAQRTEEERVLNIARAHSMKTFEDLYAEPPPYSPQPPASDSGTQDVSSRSLPKHEDLDFQSSPLEIPTPAECIAHLKLLHAFAKLRHEIGNYDGLFGISMETVDVNDIDTHTMAERIRDKRWSVFVTKAVARFEKWWDTLTGMSTWYAPIRTDDFETASDSLYAGKFHIIQHLDGDSDMYSPKVSTIWRWLREKLQLPLASTGRTHGVACLYAESKNLS